MHVHGGGLTYILTFLPTQLNYQYTYFTLILVLHDQSIRTLLTLIKRILITCGKHCKHCLGPGGIFIFIIIALLTQEKTLYFADVLNRN